MVGIAILAVLVGYVLVIVVMSYASVYRTGKSAGQYKWTYKNEYKGRLKALAYDRGYTAGQNTPDYRQRNSERFGR